MNFRQRLVRAQDIVQTRATAHGIAGLGRAATVMNFNNEGIWGNQAGWGNHQTGIMPQRNDASMNSARLSILFRPARLAV